MQTFQAQPVAEGGGVSLLGGEGQRAAEGGPMLEEQGFTLAEPPLPGVKYITLNSYIVFATSQLCICHFHPNLYFVELSA